MVLKVVIYEVAHDLVDVVVLRVEAVVDVEEHYQALVRIATGVVAIDGAVWSHSGMFVLRKGVTEKRVGRYERVACL